MRRKRIQELILIGTIMGVVSATFSGVCLLLFMALSAGT